MIFLYLNCNIAFFENKDIMVPNEEEGVYSRKIMVNLRVEVTLRQFAAFSKFIIGVFFFFKSIQVNCIAYAPWIFNAFRVNVASKCSSNRYYTVIRVRIVREKSLVRNIRHNLKWFIGPIHIISPFDHVLKQYVIQVNFITYFC